MVEVWRPIKSEPGYEASDLGRVRSLTRTIQFTSRGKLVSRQQGGRILRSHNNGSGYRAIQLGKGNHRYIHRLVAEVFLGPIPESMWVCHNDGNPANNVASNLRYDTAKNNEADKKRHGTRKSEKSHFAVLSKLQVEAIKELHPKFSQSQLASIFSVSQPTISRVVTGFCWSE